MESIKSGAAGAAGELKWDELIAQAAEARRNAHAPYSGFPVGAALVGESGRVFTACNVENASYGLSMCAERNAVAQAVAAGERRFRALGIVTETGAAPCGACRQVLIEFNPAGDLAVALVDTDGRRQDFTLADLLPHSFTSDQLPSRE